MSTKRTSSEPSPVRASLSNVMTGKSYEIPLYKDFIIGNSLTSSIFQSQTYMSRCHCVISHKNGQFMIYDNESTTGTFINFNKLPKDKTHLTILNNGDLIGFGNKRNFDVVYKFSLSTIAEKSPRLEELNDFSGKIKELNKNFKNTLKKLHDEVIDLNVEKLVLHHGTQIYFSKFKSLQNSASEYVSQLDKEIINIENMHQDLTKQISEYKNIIISQRECLDNKDSQGSSIEMESFKKELYGILEKDFECSICNEVIVKTCVANCFHSFCTSCINQWLNKSKICPICRTPVKFTTNCLATDDFITNLCNAIGGTVKEQRNNLQKERIVVPVAIPKRRRNIINNRRQNPRPDSDVLNDVMIYEPHVEVVDLTNASP